MSVDWHSESHDSPLVESTTKKKGERPPFKLCFAKQQETGRSDVSTSKINALCITPKFYARDLDNLKKEDINKTTEEIKNEEGKTPKSVYQWPMLTSHTYGWWHERGIQPKDPRFNYHKKTSDLVSFRMKIYNEDRKLKGFNY